MTRKLRIQSISLQVALTWDDGKELTPGPDLQPVVLSLSQAKDMLDGLEDEVVKLAEQIKAQEEQSN